MVLTARLLGPGDAGHWRALRGEAVRDYPDAFLATPAEVAALTAGEIAAMLGQGRSWGLFEGEEMIGMAALLRSAFARTRHRAEIGGFYLRPGAQGGGGADHLMAALTGAARQAGIWQLELHVSSRNPRAIRFYERHGFRREGRLPNAVAGPEGSVDDWFYTRDLRPDAGEEGPDPGPLSPDPR